MDDYYKILEISQNASQEQIKKSYRRLAKLYHPDANPDNKKVTDRFKKINEAYSILSDINKKAEYDEKRVASFRKTSSSTFKEAGRFNQDSSGYSYNGNPQNFSKSKPNDVFEDFFGFKPKHKQSPIENSNKNSNKNSDKGFSKSKNQNDKNNNEEIKPVKLEDAYRTIFGNRKF